MKIRTKATEIKTSKWRISCNERPKFIGKLEVVESVGRRRWTEEKNTPNQNRISVQWKKKRRFSGIWGKRVKRGSVWEKRGRKLLGGNTSLGVIVGVTSGRNLLLGEEDIPRSSISTWSVEKTNDPPAPPFLELLKNCDHIYLSIWFVSVSLTYTSHNFLYS
jgi:hypothetical protein